MRPPTVLSIAGSDSGGGAGIQADLKAFAATGVHGATAITSVTSQHTQGVERVDPLPADAVTAQIHAVFEDLDVQAVKTGMLHSAEIVEAVALALEGEQVPVVVDPVMVATSGDALMEGSLAEALARLAEVTTLATPNVLELEQLTGQTVGTLDEAREAAGDLLERGWKAVLAKGGHLGTEDAVDILVTDEHTRELAYPRLEGSFHGAGCTYSSLIAGLLARGHELEGAVREARARMQRALEASYGPGAGPGVLDALGAHQPGPGEGAALSQAAWRAVAVLEERLVPEVGINMAQAPEDATGVGDVLSLSRRVTRSGRGFTVPGPVVRGASSHVARVVLAAREVDPGMSCAMNVAFGEDVLRAAEGAGLSWVRFDREDEPEGVSSTMSWGTVQALKRDPGADLVVDGGGVGKEAMVRILAEDPGALVEKLEALCGALEA